MSSGKITYSFTAKPWRYTGKGGWYFLSLPEELSAEIRQNLRWMEEGWGRIKISAQIGHSCWETALWFDTKLNTYLLPLKAEIRTSEQLLVDEAIEVSFRI